MKTIIEFFGSPIMRLCLLIGGGMSWIAAYNLIEWAAVEGVTLASWIQAFGSVVAILVAIWVMNNQHREAKKQKQIERIDLQMNLGAALSNCAQRVVSVLEEVVLISDSRKLTLVDLTYIRSQLSHALAAVDRVEVVGMHRDDIKHCGRLSIACSKTISYASLAKENLAGHAGTLCRETSRQIIEVQAVIVDIGTLQEAQQKRLNELVG